MHYSALIKRIRLPEDFAAPRRLTYGDISAYAIARDHLRDDVSGINASLELIRRTRGGPWPTRPVTEADNYVDIIWHECEFRDGKSFTYTVYDNAGIYLGCCYLYPLGTRTKLSDDLLGHDVDVSWWVTPNAYAASRYAKLYHALRTWTSTDFPFENPHYSNLDIPDTRPASISILSDEPTRLSDGGACGSQGTRASMIEIGVGVATAPS